MPRIENLRQASPAWSNVLVVDVGPLSVLPGTGFVRCARPRLSARIPPSTHGPAAGVPFTAPPHAALGLPLAPVKGRRHTIPTETRGYRASPSRAARLQALQASNRHCRALLLAGLDLVNEERHEVARIDGGGLRPLFRLR
jgi:hypothetical protein